MFIFLLHLRFDCACPGIHGAVFVEFGPSCLSAGLFDLRVCIQVRASLCVVCLFAWVVVLTCARACVYAHEGVRVCVWMDVCLCSWLRVSIVVMFRLARCVGCLFCFVALVQRRATHKVPCFLGGAPLDLGIPGPSRQNPASGDKIDPLGALGRVFDLKCRSCGRDRRCTSC